MTHPELKSRLSQIARDLQVGRVEGDRPSTAILAVLQIIEELSERVNGAGSEVERDSELAVVTEVFGVDLADVFVNAHLV